MDYESNFIKTEVVGNVFDEVMEEIFVSNCCR